MNRQMVDLTAYGQYSDFASGLRATVETSRSVPSYERVAIEITVGGENGEMIVTDEWTRFSPQQAQGQSRQGRVGFTCRAYRTVLLWRGVGVASGRGCGLCDLHKEQLMPHQLRQNLNEERSIKSENEI